MKANKVLFAKNVRHLREKLGKSQKEVADSLGVDERRVSYWESGDCPFPKMTVLIQYVDILGFRDIYRLLTEDISIQLP